MIRCFELSTIVTIAIIFSGVTRKYIESGQAKTTLPFGWVDVSNLKTFGEVAVASFNQVSFNLKFLVNLI